jgi:hypothetical protein
MSDDDGLDDDGLDDDGNPIPRLDPMATPMRLEVAIGIADEWHRWDAAIEQWTTYDPPPPTPLADAASTYAALIVLVRASRFDDARRLAMAITRMGFDTDDPTEDPEEHSREAERLAWVRTGLIEALIDEVERREAS